MIYMTLSIRFARKTGQQKLHDSWQPGGPHRQA